MHNETAAIHVRNKVIKQWREIAQQLPHPAGVTIVMHNRRGETIECVPVSAVVNCGKQRHVIILPDHQITPEITQSIITAAHQIVNQNVLSQS